MAVVYADGFDCYSAVEQVHNMGWSTDDTANCSFSATAGRYGGGALTGLSSAVFWNFPFYADQGETFYVMFAYFHDGLVAGETNILTVQSIENTRLGALSYDQGGTVRAYNNPGTLLGTSAGTPMTSGTWHWVEIKFTLGTSAATGAIEIKIDGSTILTFSSIDTFVTSEPAASLRIGGNGGSWKFDDFIILDTTGADMNGYKGDLKIDRIFPNGDGGVVDWTRNTGANDYAVVDETSPNGDTDYVAASTAGTETRFTMTSLIDSPDDIWAVVPRAYVKKSDAGDNTVRLLIHSSGTEALGATRGVSTGYMWLGGFDAFTRNPNGAIAWTDGALNALQAGIEIVA